MHEKVSEEKVNNVDAKVQINLHEKISEEKVNELMDPN